MFSEKHFKTRQRKTLINLAPFQLKGHVNVLSKLSRVEVGKGPTLTPQKFKSEFFFENLSILWETLLLNKTALACCKIRGLSLRGAKTLLPEPFSSNIRTADLITGVWRYGFEVLLTVTV